jgi:hypothetical protein
MIQNGYSHPNSPDYTYKDLRWERYLQDWDVVKEELENYVLFSKQPVIQEFMMENMPELWTKVLEAFRETDEAQEYLMDSFEAQEEGK